MPVSLARRTELARRTCSAFPGRQIPLKKNLQLLDLWPKATPQARFRNGIKWRENLTAPKAELPDTYLVEELCRSI